MVATGGDGGMHSKGAAVSFNPKQQVSRGAATQGEENQRDKERERETYEI